MPKISENKRERIKEDILSLLFENSPRTLHTNKIAHEIIRDEEFTLTLLKELHEKNMIKIININKKDKTYLARKRWTLNPEVYSAYRELLDK